MTEVLILVVLVIFLFLFIGGMSEMEDHLVEQKELQNETNEILTALLDTITLDEDHGSVGVNHIYPPGSGVFVDKK
jgi:succinate dehydrogenase hydrophobic anchor subunit